jgi:hypothetical protein
VTARTIQTPAPDLASAETHLLNAQLRARRRVAAGEMTAAEYEALRPTFDAALAALRMLACATEPPHLIVVAAWGPR